LVLVLGLCGIAAAGFSLMPGGTVHPLYALLFFAAALVVGLSLKTTPGKSSSFCGPESCKASRDRACS
jgi:hypothetical protein